MTGTFINAAALEAARRAVNTIPGAALWTRVEEAIRAYLAALGTQPVPAVKGLEWKEGARPNFSGNRYWRAQTAFDWGYRVYFDDGRYVWQHNNADFDTLEQAQAAIQADYEVRIRSALAPATQAGDMVGALREAQIDAIYDAVRPYVREFVDFQIVRYVITKAIAASGGGR
ncbi:MAG: hypothetical protein E5X86_19665 [Mesorhizobium sp.]|uniref:hypothetical protein n=1 Tax=Mesorhizobium sp. TaxID=1871066 RepID=UPI0012150BAB|nr:hypothetical protein [Mesorhizobium sp.]TIO15591.1 MAG: hypothetical protein E5X86_19665 [Mesorhizobium sp.]